MLNSGVKNIQKALLSPEAQKQLIPTGPRIVHHSTKARKTIDTEDTDLKYSAKPDGTLVTEKIQTTEHEEFCDDELPEKDDHSTGSRERVEHKVSEHRTPNRCLFISLSNEKDIERGTPLSKCVVFYFFSKTVSIRNPLNDFRDNVMSKRLSM